MTVINGGSVGAGGTGNLTESTDYGLARLIYTIEPTFQPLAADLITIDPGDGSSTASRQRLEGEPEDSSSAAPRRAASRRRRRAWPPDDQVHDPDDDRGADVGPEAAGLEVRRPPSSVSSSISTLTKK